MKQFNFYLPALSLSFSLSTFSTTSSVPLSTVPKSRLRLIYISNELVTTSTQWALADTSVAVFLLGQPCSSLLSSPSSVAVLVLVHFSGLFMVSRAFFEDLRPWFIMTAHISSRYKAGSPERPKCSNIFWSQGWPHCRWCRPRYCCHILSFRVSSPISVDFFPVALLVDDVITF